MHGRGRYLAAYGTSWGVAATLGYGRLERRFSLADIMRVGLLIETVTHLVLALTTLPAVALVVIAAEQHASRLVVPSSQRTPATRWTSHKDIASASPPRAHAARIASS